MKNLTNYNSQELSLIFLNEEYFYTILRKGARRNNFSIIKETAEEFFIFTSEQMEDLEETFNNEVEEIEEENK